MAANARNVVLDTVDTMASDMRSSWDSALNWAATADALVDVILAIGSKVEPDHFTVLLSTAAMARRQSLHAVDDGEGHDHG